MNRLRWVVALCLIRVASAAGALPQAQLIAGCSLREFPIPCSPDEAACVAAMAPYAAEIAMLGPPPVRGVSYSVRICDYRQPTKPMEVITGLVRVTRSDARLVLRQFRGLRYSPGGDEILLPNGPGLDVFSVGAGPPTQVRNIDLGLSEERPNFQPVDARWSPDGSHVAVIFSFSIFHQGVVRVYDAATGKLQWERSCNFVEMGGEAWSPDGRKLAVTLLSGQPHTAYPPRAIKNLVILDSRSGQVLLAIDTKDLAGPVCFGPDNAVVTAPLHFEPEGHDRWHHETAKVWEATTGKLIRRIASPGRDIHNRLELSQDGKVLLAYVGREKSGFSLKALEDIDQVLDRRLQLYDYRSGDVIATFPDLTKGCSAGYDSPSFQLNADGHRVLVYWPNLGCPASVFELQ